MTKEQEQILYGRYREICEMLRTAKSDTLSDPDGLQLEIFRMTIIKQTLEWIMKVLES